MGASPPHPPAPGPHPPPGPRRPRGGPPLHPGRTPPPTCPSPFPRGPPPDPAGGPSGPPSRLALIEDLNDRFPLLEDPTTGTRVGIGVATGADGVFVCRDAVDVEPDRLLPLSMVRDTTSGELSWSGDALVFTPTERLEPGARYSVSFVGAHDARPGPGLGRFRPRGGVEGRARARTPDDSGR